MIKTLQEVDKQCLQGFLIANNNYYSDYTEIFLKEYLQLLYHGLLFLLPVATTEAGHCWEYLVYICACCAYRSITKSILHELGGFVCFLPSQSLHITLSVSHRCNFLVAKMHGNAISKQFFRNNHSII